MGVSLKLDTQPEHPCLMRMPALVSMPRMNLCLLVPFLCHRLAAATSAELKIIGYLAHEGSPMSVGSEKLMLRCLLNSCKQTLAVLRSTIAEDEAVPRDATISTESAANKVVHDRSAEAAPSAAADPPERYALQYGRECLQLAVRWRLGYMAALAKCMKQCEQAFAMLDVHGHPLFGNGELAYDCHVTGYERELSGPEARTVPTAQDWLTDCQSSRPRSQRLRQASIKQRRAGTRPSGPFISCLVCGVAGRNQGAAALAQG